MLTIVKVVGKFSNLNILFFRFIIKEIIEISKIKNQKEVYIHQQIKIYRLRDSVRHILWNRQEYLNSVQVVTPVFNLIEKCENFERKFSHLQFVDY